jgi:uncharacterized surface protein with fasciclin (FAS1) repeats
MHRRAALRILLAGAPALAVAACSGGRVGSGGDTVVDVARSHRLNAFLKAIEGAGLTGTLEGPGPYTVFAPSDRAFATARLPRDPEALESIMRYHIVPGTFPSAFLDGHDLNYTTASGRSVAVDGTGVLTVDGARVITPDLEAINGVIHVIDRVLTPG